MDLIAANVDYNAVWNESRGTWYIKVTVPDENLDAGSVKSIHAITEAGVDLDEPRELTPDTDTVMWFGVAKGDGEVTLKRDGKYAYKVVRTDGSEYIFSFTYASGSVTGATNLVQAALDKVNTTVVTDRGAAYELVMEVAEILGLNVDGDFAGLVQGRAEAAAKDLLDNRGDGYDLATIRAAFDEIVATRLVFEQSVALFSAASETNPLTDLTYITMLIENLENVEYQTVAEGHTIHSGKAISEKVTALEGLVADFEALPEANQEAALAAVITNRPEGGYLRSQSTLDALADAIAEQEGEIEGEEDESDN